MEDNLVQGLIECEKIITNKPHKEMLPDRKSLFILRNDFSCVSTDGTRYFEVFLRRNIMIPHLFSIGLRYRTKEGTVILCRYNGKHEHKNKIANTNKFNDFHIHRLHDKQLSDDTANMLDAESTQRYITFDEALLAFLNDCHIQDWQSIFPNLENEINQVALEGM